MYLNISAPSVHAGEGTAVDKGVRPERIPGVVEESAVPLAVIPSG